MTTVLVVKQGPLAGQRVELDRELVIGREGGDLTIDDAELSRRHAVVRVVEGGPQIEDLGSLNGTYVNGRRIDAATRLSGGDSIKLGATVLEVEAARAAATIASPVQPAEPSAPLAVPGETAAPSEPFGTYKATAPPKRRWRGGVASRQLLPMLLSWAAVAGTAVALAIYFAQH